MTAPLGSRRWATLMALGVRAGFGGDPRLRIRNVAITLAAFVATVLLGAVWTGPAAFDRPIEVDLARAAWPASALDVALPVIVVPAGSDVWFDEMQSRWGDERMTIVQVAVDSATPPPPGVERLPAVGEVVVSTALADLLNSPNSVDLDARVPGTVIGRISRPGLTGPRELRAYVGVDADRMASPERLGGWGVPDGGGARYQGGTMLLVLFAVAAAVLPLLYLLAAALRIYSDRRERRVASLVLLGVPLRDMVWLSFGESILPLGFGVIAGLALARSVMAMLIRILPAGYHIFPEDLTVRGAAMVGPVLVLLLIAMAAAISSVRHLRDDSALDVVRQANPASPRPAWALMPLVGTGMLFLIQGRAQDIAAGRLGPTVFASVGLGLAIAGLAPTIGALQHILALRLASRGSRYPGVELAFKRLAHSPAGTARLAGIAGLLVLAATIPQGIFPVLERANNLIAADSLDNLQSGIMLDLVDGTIAPQALTSAVNPATTAVFIRTDIEETNGTSTVKAWVGSCRDFALLLVEPPSPCGPNVVYSVNAPAGLARPSPDSTWRFGIDQVGGRLLADTFTLPPIQELPVGFPQLLERDPFLVIPFEALPTSAAEALYADPNRLKQIVTHTDDIESTRDGLWTMPHTFAEYGPTATPEELQQDSTRQLDFLRIIVSAAVAVGMTQITIAIALAAAAHATEQRPTTASVWALGAPTRFNVGSHVTQLLMPLVLALVTGAILGTIIGTRYLAFAYAGSPSPAGWLLGFDLTTTLVWVGIAATGSLLAVAASLPLTIRNLTVTDLRAE